MKRFAVFCYSQYYPSGGMSDFRASFNTYEEAQKYIKEYPSYDDGFNHRFENEFIEDMDNY